MNLLRTAYDLLAAATLVGFFLFLAQMGALILG